MWSKLGWYGGFARRYQNCFTTEFHSGAFLVHAGVDWEELRFLKTARGLQLSQVRNRCNVMWRHHPSAGEDLLRSMPTSPGKKWIEQRERDGAYVF